MDIELLVARVKAEIQEQKTLMPLIKERNAIQAQIAHSYYESLVKNGFSARNALEIIKVHGCSALGGDTLMYNEEEEDEEEETP